MNWNEFYVDMAKFVATKSKDRSTTVGAVAVDPRSMSVIDIGYNGFPRGIADDNEAYHERPMKYLVTEHAERNLIYNCARTGKALDGAILYMHYQPIPCCDCARGVIQAGIKTIVGPDLLFPGKGDQWLESLAVAEDLLIEAGVKRIYIPKRDLVHTIEATPA
jgi:dCMP deaminase